MRLIAPASPFDRGKAAAGMQVLRALGLVPVVDRRALARSGFFAGPDEARAASLQQALEERETRAVWCIRGGYGTARLLPLLDWRRLRRELNPKLVIGFSDVTALLLQLAQPGGFVAVHGPVITQLASVPAALRRWLWRLLNRPEPAGIAPLGRLRTLIPGVAEGRLVVGNLSILASLCGTPYLPSLRGALLCIEDTGEEAYRLDRLFWQVVSAGLLKGARGIVLGELAGCTPQGTGPHSARRVLERAVSALGLPALSGAPFGHGRRNLALAIGVRARLDAGARTVTLLEPAVRSSK